MCNHIVATYLFINKGQKPALRVREKGTSSPSVSDYKKENLKHVTLNQ